MEQDILQILEFNEIRRMLAQLCPSSLSKAKAMDLQPSSEPRICLLYTSPSPRD